MRRFLICILLFLFINTACWAAPATVRILHVNDFHGFANPESERNSTKLQGGAVRLAMEIDQLRSQHPTLLLAAGDMIQGDNWARLSEGKSVIELMNLLGFDAMSLGNHEFDFGQETLKKRIAEAKFPLMAANLEGLPAVLPRAVFNRGGLKITVIGLVTDDTPQCSHPRNMGGLTFRPPLDTARQQIKEVQGDSDLVILLTHQGIEHDRAMARALCGTAEGSALPILIVGGHTHTRLTEPVRIGNCAVVQAWEHGRTLGLVDLTIDGRKLLKVTGQLVDLTVDQHVTVSQVAGLVERYNQDAANLLGQQAGTTAVDLVQSGSRLRETNLGNLVADILRQATGAQVGIINGGSLRTGIPKGTIRVSQIHSALPFNNYLVAVRMTGRQLLSTFEHGVSGVQDEEGRFPQISGASFSYDPSRPVGKRVTAASVAGKPVQPDQEYTVATVDFIAAGGDGYKAFGEAIRSSGDFSEVAGAMKSSRLVYNDPGRFLRDVVLEILATGRIIDTAVEGRIRELR